MTKVDILSGWGSNCDTTGNFSAVCNGMRFFEGGVDDAESRLTHRHGGTLSDLWIYVSSYSAGGGTQFFRIDENGSGTALDINLTGTGEFEDTSTVATSAGNDYRYFGDCTSGSYFARGYGCSLDVSGSITTIHGVFFDGRSTSSADQEYYPVGYSDHYALPMTNGPTWQTGGTAKNMVVYASGHISDQEFNLQQNGSDTALQITITGTGEFEDTDSFTVTAEDELQYETPNAGSVTLETAIFQFDADGNNKIQIMAVDTGARSIGSSDKVPLGGELTDSTTIEYMQHNVEGGGTMSNYFAYCTGGSGTLNMTSNVNGSNDTALQLSITGTGFFEDATGTVVTSAGDLICGVASDSTRSLEIHGILMGYAAGGTALSTAKPTVSAIIG